MLFHLMHKSGVFFAKCSLVVSLVDGKGTSLGHPRVKCIANGSSQ